MKKSIFLASVLAVSSFSINAAEIKESILFEKKIFKKSKGFIKLLAIGEPSSNLSIEVSYASKKAIEKVEKLGGKVNLTQNL